MTTKKSLSELVPDYIASIHPYVPGKPIEEVERELGIVAIKLASNENPFGPSPRALEAAMKFLGQSHRYPDAGGFYLREDLAARHGIPRENIVLGAGSTELIQLLCRIYLGPGRLGLTSEGSFLMFELSCRAAGTQAVLTPLRDYTFDLDALADRLDDRVRAVYIANPNNPTGTMVSATALERFLDSVPPDVLVILDEAYCDYVEHPDYSRSLEAVRAGRYLIVLRTFSKVYGLAGLRIGYGVGHPDIIAALDRVRSPFNVSGLAQVAARAALGDHEHVRRSVEANGRGRAFLIEELSRLGVKLVPSHTNFLYVETGGEAEEVHRALLKEGVIIRPLGFMGMPQGLRITIGTEVENHRVVDALSDFLQARR